ncbi:PEP/pyruvate-binding domain-containing protein [Bacteroidota bacterium]
MENDKGKNTKKQSINLSGLPNSTSVHNVNVDKLIADQTERLKELACINKTTQILKEGKGVYESLHQICGILPAGWQYPEYTYAKIEFNAESYYSPGFKSSQWAQNQSFETIDGRIGFIEIYYSKEFPIMDEGPFLKEERHLINNVSSLINGYLNSIIAKDMILKRPSGDADIGKRIVQIPQIPGRKLLQKFLNKKNASRDVYHDLMPYKVKEILLVANLYDAYSIEKEGRFSEHVLGEYHQLNLTSVPRITGASNETEVFKQLESKHYDMVIFMVGVDKKVPAIISKKIKKEFPYIPVMLLLNNNSEMIFFTGPKKIDNAFDKIFVWNGDSEIFFAMIKNQEDKINVENDTRKGLVRVILIVEDSAQFYSRYLPMLYKIVLEQTRQIIQDVSTDELYKVLRLRARPKILLASTYEEAVEIFNKYSDYMLCLISDVNFEKDGLMDNEAGLKLVCYAKAKKDKFPTIIQSSQLENAELAYKLKSTFIDKNSENLNQEFRSFITHHLGFGNFIYKDKSGRQIAVAKSLQEFENFLRTIPDESVIYHAKRNHFSLWLMARGEIQVARIINPAELADFKDVSEVREYLINVIHQFRNEQNSGKIIPFEESSILDESNIISLSGGSLGGKGRGIAFINSLIYNYDFKQHVPNINISAPKTFIIGTDEFEFFIERNKLQTKINNGTESNEISKYFLAGKLSTGLIKKLRKILSEITKPIAIRSSGLFEDSLMQPFAGIFETYLLPNNNPELNIRLEQCKDAIKLVFASVYSKTARSYIEAINYKIDEEKMAVVIQEVVGNQFGNAFYPHISGVAQSYNYYPYSHMNPEEGFAVAALGLGKYVVEGEKAYRFSPKYPKTEINSPKDQYKNSQFEFFAVDLNKEEINLLEGDTAGLIRLNLDDAEMHDNIKHLASVYDFESDRILPGTSNLGPRIINFADILKYNYIPLAKTIEVVLDVVKEAMGSPVEIEFAIDLKKDSNHRATFYLLQIKPLIGTAHDYEIEMDKISKDEILLLSNKGMGNGVISEISDLIYVDTAKFDKSETEEMAKEIEILNKKMVAKDKKYILLGPGRWGTRDKWIGIPVNWPQISNAKVIIETSLEGFPLDASSGSHFFHNVTSMNVGYFSVQPELKKDIVSYEVLNTQKIINKTKHFRHVKFNKPLKVRMDGKQRIGVITYDK